MNPPTILGMPLTPQTIADAVGSLIKDVSLFVPEPYATVARLMADGEEEIAALLWAKASGVSKDVLVAGIQSAMKASADAQMASELGPSNG